VHCNFLPDLFFFATRLARQNATLPFVLIAVLPDVLIVFVPFIIFLLLSFLKKGSIATIATLAICYNTALFFTHFCIWAQRGKRMELNQLIAAGCWLACHNADALFLAAGC